MNRVVLGLDLGQVQDYSALCALETSRPEGERLLQHEVRALKRWPLGTPYERVALDVATACARPAVQGADLVVDETGVGRPVVEMVRGQRPACGRLIPVTITGGHAVTQYAPGAWRVAKVVLISTLQVLLGSRRLRFAEGLPLTPALLRELDDYRVKVTENASETFGARQGANDDLVLSVALACWYAERCAPLAVGDLGVSARPSPFARGAVPPGVFAARTGAEPGRGRTW